MKCLVIGTGGVGGPLAAMLALAGNDVTCVARGEHRKNMLEGGLKFHSGIKGEQTIYCYEHGKANINAISPAICVATAEDYDGKAELILVCVKSYSIGSVVDCIRRASDSRTIVLPILNVYGIGPRIARLCPEVRVIDGCIYIVGYINAPGEVTQDGEICKLVFGARDNDGVLRAELEGIRETLSSAGIKAILSDDINRDTFTKWGFISAMSGTGAFYDVSMGILQHEGQERDLFVSLTQESTALGHKMGIRFREEPVTANLRVIDAMAPDATSSMQKDLKKGRSSEIEDQLFEMLELCRKYGVEAPFYEKVAAKFRACGFCFQK